MYGRPCSPSGLRAAEALLPRRPAEPRASFSEWVIREVGPVEVARSVRLVRRFEVISPPSNEDGCAPLRARAAQAPDAFYDRRFR